jgi:hypothetical protein
MAAARRETCEAMRRRELRSCVVGVWGEGWREEKRWLAAVRVGDGSLMLLGSICRMTRFDANLRFDPGDGFCL